MFPGTAAALDDARRRSGLPTAATDQDNAEMAERLQGSLIGTTYVQTVLEKRDLRTISIDGVVPTIETFENGTYRYAKVFHVILRQQPGAAAKSFMEFLHSADGCTHTA